MNLNLTPMTVCVVIIFLLPALAGFFALLASGRLPHPLVCVTEGTLIVWAVMEVCMVPLVAVGASFSGSIPVVFTALLLTVVILIPLSIHRLVKEWKKKVAARKGAASPAGSAMEGGKRREGGMEAAPSDASGMEGQKNREGVIKFASVKGTAPSAASDFEGRKRGKTGRQLSERICDFIFLLPLIVMLLIVLRGTAVYQHTDADDSRFVVNAVDMVRTDRLLRVYPATGQDMDVPRGELRKDAVAPWAFYIALLSHLSGEKAATIAHSYLPGLMMLLITCALFTLGRSLFQRERWKVYVFVTVCWLVTLFGYYSVYSAEAFVMGRLWQGKAMLAGFGIPVLLEIFFRIYARPEERAGYISLAIAIAALDLLSSQSIVLTSAAAAFFAISYAVILRKPLVLIKMGVACIPNLLLLALYAFA